MPDGGRSCHRSCHCSSIHSSIHYMVFARVLNAFEAACLVMSGIGVGLSSSFLWASEGDVSPEAAKIVNLHFPWIYIFARIYIPNLRKLKGKCKFYIFPKNVFLRRKIEDLCKNEHFHFFLHTKNYYFFSISLVSSLDF